MQKKVLWKIEFLRVYSPAQSFEFLENLMESEIEKNVIVQIS